MWWRGDLVQARHLAPPPTPLQAQGLARSQGLYLGPEAETQEADQLRGAVTEALCRSDKRRGQFAEALTSIQTEDNLKQCEPGGGSGQKGEIPVPRRGARC